MAVEPPAALRSTAVERPVPLPHPGLVTFSARRGVRRLLTVLAGAATLAATVTGALAWQSRTDTSYAVLAGAAVVALVLWSARGRATGTQVSIEDGILRIVQGPGQHRFPLTATYPPIDVLGEPGERGWKVLVQRKGMTPYTITARMVDPRQFTDAIRRFRPEA